MNVPTTLVSTQTSVTDAPPARAANLAIVILNYRTPDLVIDCLRSLAPQIDAVPASHVVVVDNASGDGSVPRISAAIDSNRWSSWATLLPSETNGGYAAGNNLGIRYLQQLSATFDFILLLNPDTLAESTALADLCEFMTNHPKAGIAGSRLEDRTGRVECSAHNLPTPCSELLRSSRLGLLRKLLPRHAVSPPIPNQPQPCEWVSGAALILRKELLDAIGLLDDRFFLYFDEVDYCRRARTAGWEIWYVPSARIIHFEGESTGISQTRKRRPRYWYNSRRRFFVKSYGITGLLLADAFWILGRLPYLAKRFLTRTPPDPKFHTLDILAGDIGAFFSGELGKIKHEAQK